MLFSDPRVSAFVRGNFIAAWESVRAVPLVEIDFGGGRRLKRTVNGNIATYLCSPDGRVLDVIPGLNAPEAYLADLRGALVLYQASRGAFEKTVLDHHFLQGAAPARKPAAAPRLKDVGKRMVELPVMNLRPEAELLAADTEFNRKERKPILHRILSEQIWRPAEITKRVYKEALHCDLDDPYLGLRSGAFNGGAYEDR